MKRPYLLSALLTIVPILALGLLIWNNPLPSADAANDPFRCTDATLYFPASGLVGWTYRDPASTDTDAHGHRTIHTGVDFFSEKGDGSPIYAPADGFVSRSTGWESANILLPDVTNVLNGERGIEIYISHLSHNLVQGSTFEAGDVIGFVMGEHIHMSVGAFIGYDDREIDETQDPSPYFGAALGYNPNTTERQPAAHWCYEIANSTSQTVSLSTATSATSQEYTVRSGDTLSGIAETFGVSVDDIVDASDIDDPDFISIGQVLVIPGGNGGPPPPEEPRISAGLTPIAGAPQLYIVKDGDTLTGIAVMFDTDVESIVDFNGLEDPDVLAIGDELLIP